MMLGDRDGIEAEPVGQHRLLDHVRLEPVAAVSRVRVIGRELHAELHGILRDTGGMAGSRHRKPANGLNLQTKSFEPGSPRGFTGRGAPGRHADRTVPGPHAPAGRRADRQFQPLPPGGNCAFWRRRFEKERQTDGGSLEDHLARTCLVPDRGREPGAAARSLAEGKPELRRGEPRRGDRGRDPYSGDPRPWRPCGGRAGHLGRDRGAGGRDLRLGDLGQRPARADGRHRHEQGRHGDARQRGGNHGQRGSFLIGHRGGRGAHLCGL